MSGIIKFDPTLPSADTPIRSAPIRSNMNALNDRTNQLTPSATDPTSTIIQIGPADKVYFDDNLYVSFAGDQLDLGSSSKGVAKFQSIGTYKEIIVYYKPTRGNDGKLTGAATIEFLEGDETSTPTTNTATLIKNNTTIGSNTELPLADSIVICSVLVKSTNTTSPGQIDKISTANITDLRPFLQKGGSSQALRSHINSTDLKTAHPSVSITNDILAYKSSTIASSVTNNATITLSTAIVGLSNNDILQISKIASPTSGSDWVIARVQSFNDVNIILDRAITTVASAKVVRVDIGQALATSSVTIPSLLAIDIKEELQKRASIVIATDGLINTPSSITAGTGITSTTGNIAATAGSLSAGTTITAGTGITSTTGNIAATAGSLSAGTTITAGTGITSTTGNITATAGSLVARGTTLTDSGGKILSAALNTVALAQGGTGLTSTPSNGQLLIGNGAGYTLSTLTGSNVTVTSGSGTIQVGIPQSVATNASVTFAGLTIAGFTSAGIVHNDASGNFSSSLVTNSDISTTAAIARSKVATGTVNQVLINDASGNLSSEAQLAISRGGTGLTSTPSNGQLLIGNGAGYTLSTLTGSNVTVTSGSGTIQVGIPQSVATNASVTFATLTLTNFVLTSSATPTITGGPTGASLATVSTAIVYVTYAPTAATTLSNITSSTTPSDGQRLYVNITNTSASFTITLATTGGSTPNIDFPSGTTPTVNVSSSNTFTFIYRSSTSKWILVAKLV